MDHFPVRYVTNNQSFECVPECPKNIKPTLFPRAAKQLFHTESIKIDSGQRFEDHLAGAWYNHPSLRNSQILIDDYWISTDHALKINSTFWRSSRSRVWWCLMQLQTKLSTPFSPLHSVALWCLPTLDLDGPRTMDQCEPWTGGPWTKPPLNTVHYCLLPCLEIGSGAQAFKITSAQRPCTLKGAGKQVLNLFRSIFW